MERILFEGKVVGTGARVTGAHFFDGRRDYIITRIRDAEHAIYGHYSNDVELFVVDPDTVRRYPSFNVDEVELPPKGSSQPKDDFADIGREVDGDGIPF